MHRSESNLIKEGHNETIPEKKKKKKFYEQKIRCRTGGNILFLSKVVL